MMTDPVADMLTRLRNANTALHPTVVMPSSKLKEEIAKILQSEGYIESFGVSADGERLLMTRFDSGLAEQNRLIVVQNWVEELRRLTAN